MSKNKRMVIEINSEVKKRLASKQIPLHDGICFLVCLYYSLHPSYLPKELVRKVLAAGIVNHDYEVGVVEWKIPLFSETETGFEWISEWMDLFKEVNPSRRGVRRDVLRRMKRFFVNNPEYRKDDVMEATKLYLKGVSQAKYCKMSHRFIYEQDGSSMLLDYVLQHREIQERNLKYQGDII